ncbi:magnesium transporter MRS2-11, chloroplastic-like [Salvia splendens]|uniref:magnesium transporter MRS2-11, chloroplastic-like n=1 Tax=Salvia splendens TaxID=180675 RepID=UPI001C269B6C|nr:magnesium transporter MRS2-11, chloroplastic-like [Salvia splendens]
MPSPILLPSPPHFRLVFTGISLSQSKQDFSRKLFLCQPRRSVETIKCLAEERESSGEAVGRSSILLNKVREYAILLNLGSLRAIAMQERVYIFNYNRRAGKAFIDALLPRLNPKNMNGGPSMPFVIEVVEAALYSRIQRTEQRLLDLEPRVQGLLEVLPNRLTANILEELRISKQTLVELGSKAGALKQMLLDILEDTHEILRICIMGRNCTLTKNDDMECSVPLEKEIAEEEEEEIEMLLENYLQRCESCHSQAERLLDSAKEMEDSTAVNLRFAISKMDQPIFTREGPNNLKNNVLDQNKKIAICYKFRHSASIMG